MTQVLYGEYELFREEVNPIYYCYSCGLEMNHINKHLSKCIRCGLTYDDEKEVSIL